MYFVYIKISRQNQTEKMPSRRARRFIQRFLKYGCMSRLLYKESSRITSPKNRRGRETRLQKNRRDGMLEAGETAYERLPHERLLSMRS